MPETRLPRGNEMRILVVTNLYPSARHPAFGTFMRTRVEGLLRAGQRVTLVANTDPAVHRGRTRKYASLAVAAVAASVRVRLARSRFDVVEAHIAFPTGLIALAATVIGGGRLVLFTHGSDVREVAWRSGLRTRLARLVFHRADLVVSNSAFMAAQAGRLGPLKREPVVVSPGIVLPDPERPIAVDARKGILFVGRLTPEKGVRELLLAVARLGRPHDVSLTLAGEGPQRGELEALASSLSIDATFLGPLPPAQVANLMDRARIVAVPSVYEEPLGLVALEGMAHGAIVVASATGGLAETIDDGTNAIAVPPGDVEALSEALARAHDLGEAAAARMQEAALRTAERHSIDASVRSTLQAYASLEEQRSSGRTNAVAASPAGQPGRRIRIGGVPVDDLTMHETVGRIDRFVASGSPHRHIAINVSKVVQASKNEKLRRIIDETDLLTADGLPIVWASRLLGTPLRERVTGIDLMNALISQASRVGHSIYFLGARQAVVDAVVERVRREFPSITVAGSRNGYWQPAEESDVVAAVRAAKPDLLFIAMGSPRKEEFLAQRQAEMNVPFAMGVGGSFDVYAGLVRRAPAVMQRLGFEWLYRVSQEPRRLFWRYAADAPRFAAIVFRDVVRSKK